MMPCSARGFMNRRTYGIHTRPPRVGLLQRFRQGVLGAKAGALDRRESRDRLETWGHSLPFSADRRFRCREDLAAAQGPVEERGPFATPMTEPDASPMVEAQGLSKIYGTFAALRDVSFSIPRGQVAAFLGPNGAGKSTTLRILTGYLTPTRGIARIAGQDVSRHRIEAAARIGYLPENGPLYPEMTPLELLRFFGEARGLTKTRLNQRIEAVVQQCSLEAVLEKSIYKLSKGYRQRLGMAQVLLHEPDILIMDEPTSGLDPNQIREVRELIRQLGQTKTVVLSTHILQEVRAVADHVILIHEGPDRLRRHARGNEGRAESGRGLLPIDRQGWAGCLSPAGRIPSDHG